MTQSRLITGPTFAEMLDPSSIRKDLREKALATKTVDPLDPINLHNISWKDGSGRIYHEVLPRELTGVETPIAVLYGRDFPTGSHKVGATYSVLIEKAITGAVDPARHTIVWPSTGNFGIGGAWVGSRMQFDSVVILPEQMSKERFEIIRSYGARLELTPGCESSVKEIYDKCHELKRSDPERIRIMNQFEDFANYRFHYYVTGKYHCRAGRRARKTGHRQKGPFRHMFRQWGPPALSPPATGSNSAGPDATRSWDSSPSNARPSTGTATVVMTFRASGISTSHGSTTS